MMEKLSRGAISRHRFGAASISLKVRVLHCYLAPARENLWECCAPWRQPRIPGPFLFSRQRRVSLRTIEGSFSPAIAVAKCHSAPSPFPFRFNAKRARFSGRAHRLRIPHATLQSCPSNPCLEKGCETGS